eukprot:gene37852-46708_t
MAKFAPPPAHADDVVIQVRGKFVWRKRADLDGTEGIVFFDGDYRDVLEPGDPRPDGSIIETPITANFREGLNVL